MILHRCKFLSVKINLTRIIKYFRIGKKWNWKEEKVVRNYENIEEEEIYKEEKRKLYWMDEMV